MLLAANGIVALFLVCLCLCPYLAKSSSCIQASSCPSFNDTGINKWSLPAACVNEPSKSFPGYRIEHVAAVYTRGPVNDPNSDNMQRMLVFGGKDCDGQRLADTFVYNPMINSWIIPNTEEPTARVGHTMTTLCETRIMLFGGSDPVTFKNDTWMFDGVTETWSPVKLSANSNSIPPRSYHSAASAHQRDNSCICKESLLVSGGLHTSFNPMWELRCIDDLTSPVTYEWVTREIPENISHYRGQRVSVFSFNTYTMFVWGNSNSYNSRELWKYDTISNGWTMISSVTHFKTSSLQSVFNNVLQKQIVTLPFRDQNEDVALLIWQNKQYFLNTTTGEISEPYRSPEPPIGRFSYYSAVIIDDAIVVYGGFVRRYSTPGRVWNVGLFNNSWHWTLSSYQDTVPPPRVITRGNGAVVGDSMYVFGGIVDNMHLAAVPNDMWQLDMKLKTWSHTWNAFHPSARMLGALAVVNNSILVLFGGVKPRDHRYGSLAAPDPNMYGDPFTKETWLYFTKERRWAHFVSSTAAPTPRVRSTLSPLKNGSLLLFGGYTEQLEWQHDLWLLDICQTNVTTTIQYCNKGWIRIGPIGDSAMGTWPYAITYYTAAIFEDSMVIVSLSVLHSKDQQWHIWEYSLTKNKWTEGERSMLPNIQIDVGSVFTAAVGMKMVVVVNELSLTTFQEYPDNNYSTFVVGVTLVYSVLTRKWLTLSQGPRVGVGVLDTHQDKVIVLGLSTRKCSNYTDFQLTVATPGCDAGQYSPDWSSDDCKPCSVGNYSSAGSKICQSCGLGLTTTTTGSTSASYCQCDPQQDYCQHGDCGVSINSSIVEAKCTCNFGYSGSRCDINHLKYIVIGSSGAFVLILIFGTLLIRKCVSYRKGQKEAKEELDTMKRVWSIGHDEIDMLDHVAAGGFGNVSKARYREITVVVKKLHEYLTWLKNEEQDFKKEIELMQSIRHPNIVLFLGAGKDANGVPFLVLEHVSRGSLKRILEDRSEVITDYRRVTFSLDTAKGMRFLHDCRPPRLHRDLKSLNLLVSQDWTVKVADFGTARAIKTRSNLRNLFKSSPVGRHRPSSNELQDSQETAPLMTSNVGTLLWQAPETIGRNTRYGKPADIYSFAIVMWEILTRKVPFDDQPNHFSQNILRLVLSGVRPSIPPGCPNNYVALMEECWQTNPADRPSFREVQRRLEEMKQNCRDQHEEED